MEEKSIGKDRAVKKEEKKSWPMLGLEPKTTWSALLAGGCHAKHRPLEGNTENKIK